LSTNKAPISNDRCRLFPLCACVNFVAYQLFVRSSNIPARPLITFALCFAPSRRFSGSFCFVCVCVCASVCACVRACVSCRHDGVHVRLCVRVLLSRCLFQPILALSPCVWRLKAHTKQTRRHHHTHRHTPETLFSHTTLTHISWAMPCHRPWRRRRRRRRRCCCADCDPTG
jgi:hypothetical protein